jgi:hypothetical protein
MLFVERRSLPRRPAREQATAIVAGSTKRGCVVTDFSRRGARLGFGAEAPLPLRFELVFATGRRVNAQLIWQREMTAGVLFDLPPTLGERLVPRWFRRLA